MPKNQKPTAAALLPVLTALGVPASAATFCLPYLTGEKPIVESVREICQDKEAARLITMTEAGKRLGYSRTTLWRMVKSGKLPSVDPTGKGKHRVRLADIIALTNGKAA